MRRFASPSLKAIACTATIAVFVIVFQATPAHATFPGENGKVGFIRAAYSQLGDDCLKLANPDGTGLTQPGACGFDTRWGPITFSPEGNRVAGPVYNPDFDTTDARLSALNGTNQVQFGGQYYEDMIVSGSTTDNTCRSPTTGRIRPVVAISGELPMPTPTAAGKRPSARSHPSGRLMDTSHGLPIRALIFRPAPSTPQLSAARGPRY